MACRQVMRRLSPILRSASRVLPVTRSAVHLLRHEALCQDLASRLTTVRCMSQAKEVPAEIVTIQSEKDFQEKVLQSQKPVVVDFHATWCGPCKLLGPRLESIIGKANGEVVMAKVDIDEQMDLAMQFNVQSVPTVLGFKDGKMLKMFIGLKEDDEIKSFVQSLL
ncbi:hypothetical protein ACOMHN_020880 [Nucella lapillus]